MPTIVSQTGNLPLTIIGASGYTSILSTRPLYLKSDILSGNIPLYLKQTPNSGVLKAETNWNFSLASNSRINHYSNGDIEYSLTDYSSNRYDSYYNTNRGREAIEYTLSHDWSVNAMDVTEDALAIGVKGWTSFEKVGRKSEASVYSTYISAINWYVLPPPTINIVRMYTYTVNWTTSIPYAYINTGGNLTLGYTDIDGNHQTVTGAITTLSTGTIGPITSQETEPSIDNWTGDPSGWPTFANPNYTLYILSSTFQDIEVITYPTIPNDAVVVGNRYFRTSELQPMLSNFIIPELVNIFQDSEYSWMNFNSPDFEVPDYSDIYLDIVYTSAPIEPGSPGYGTTLSSVTSSTTERKIYKFGGFYRYSEFFSTLLDPDTMETKTTIDGQDYYNWYIIVKDDGSYSTIVLSDYITWNFQYSLSFPFGSLLSDGDHLVVGWKKISIKSLSVTKVATYPNCGKVDIYFPKYGSVSSFISGDYSIKSPNHGLMSGDRVKFTEALGSGTTLNGLKYVLPVDSETFNIYYDNSFSKPAYIYDTLTSTGVRWSAVDGQTWGYGFSLYSPTDKNGYGTTLSLITSNEPANTGETPLDRAVSVLETKPQHDFTGQRSWTNYYPFERFDSSEGTVFGVVNGNKFGSSVSLKKYGNDYILMVAEEGASESFQLLSSFETIDDGIAKPRNKRVVPSFLPYGRLHFYKIFPQTKSIEYLTSYSPSDNPWASYEIVNRQERIIGQISQFNNKSITTNDFATYNNSNSNYWNGAKLLQWSKSYFYNSDIDFQIPDQNSYPYEFGFVDRLKAADFEISGNTIYCVSTSNVKNGDFLNNLRLKNLHGYFRSLSFNITTPDQKTTSLYTVNNSPFTTNDISIQKEEYDYFGSKVVLKNSGLYFGWASDYRPEEYLYYYNRIGSDYSIKDIVISFGARGFGDYFAVDNGFLLSNKSSYVDESGNPTTNPLQSIQVYKYDGPGNQYYYAGSLTPTIDLSNPIYSLVNSDSYELTANLSYDGTNSNSATYILDLDDNYDIKDDLLVIRDLNEYAGFKFDYSSGRFVNKFHKFSPRTTGNSILKIFTGHQAAFFDDLVEYDLGEYHKSLQIFDASQVDESSLNNYLFTIDTHYPNYLPLYLKTVEGNSSGNLNLKSLGHDVFSSGLNLNLQAPIPTGTGVNLFLKQVDVHSTGLSLFHKSTSIQSGDLSLFVRNTIYETGITLVMNPEQRAYFPLFIENVVPTNFIDTNLNLSLYSTYKISASPIPSSTYDPNNPPDNYFVMPLYLKTYSYGDFAEPLPLYLLSPGTGISSSVNLYQNAGGDSGSVFNNTTIYMNCSGYRGNDTSGMLNLWIQRPIAETLPLFVYNTITTGNVPLYSSGSNSIGTGITLNISGYHMPTGNLKLFTRGDL